MAISQETKRALWASSGGFCQNPECRRNLIPLFETGEVTNLDELAHIIARSNKGPRGEASLNSAERDRFENILILCPTCHTLVDKNPKHYPDDLLQKWKREHAALIKNAIVPMFDTREQLRRRVHEILARNKAIFDEYGPFAKRAENPLSDAAEMWQKLVLSDIIPNNREIVRLLSAHRELLQDNEPRILEQFRIHVEALEYNHVSGDKCAAAPIFPKEMGYILS